LRDVLVHANPIAALLALLSTILALLAVVARWQRLLGGEAPRFTLLFRATVIGQMLNILVPFRAGEVTRAWAARKGGVSMARVAGSLAIEKAIDLAMFGVSTAFLALIATAPLPALRNVRWIVLPLAAAALVAAVALVARPDAAARLETLSGGQILRTALTASASILTSARGLSVVIVWSAIVLLTSAAANQLLLFACNIDVPWWTGLAILVVLQAGTVPPALPGRLGVYNYLTVLTLNAVGVDRVTAAAYSIALYGIAYVPKLLLGAIFFASPAWRSASLNASRG
jgi:glycosyltransferase 2 family protein